MTAATTTATSTTAAGGTRPRRVPALVATELKLIMRNRTAAVSAILLPLGIGLFWAFTFDTDGDATRQSIVVALQLAVVLGMSVYVTATQTLVARRQARVLKRMRTTGLGDAGLLVATTAPSVALGIVQLAVFAVIDAVNGTPAPIDPVPLVPAVLGGLALAVAASFATAGVTTTPERAQITTMPIVFVMLGGAVVLTAVPLDSGLQALVLLPGAAVGQLVQLAMTGATWEPGAAGLPAVVPSLIALVAWTIVFGVFAKRRMRWDPRH
jgi:ABC-2 type transport system permease protein